MSRHTPAQVVMARRWPVPCVSTVGRFVAHSIARGWLACASLLVVLGPSLRPTDAADLYYDVIPSTADIDGGTATWSGTTWKSTASGTTGVAWATNDSAFFETIVGTPTTTTITLAGSQTATALTFSGTGYTLTGGTLALAGDGATNWINANADASIASALTRMRFSRTGGAGMPTVTISGGGTIVSRAIIGNGGSTPVTVRQTGGAYTLSDYMMVGGNAVANSQGHYILDSGSLTITNGLYLGWGSSSSGTFTQNGGRIETQLDSQGLQFGLSTSAGAAAGNGTYNLNGGVLVTTFGIAPVNFNFGGSLNFGGGTFRARASFNTSNQSAVTTTIGSGAAALIDTNGNTVTWSAALTGTSAAGLTKLGTGTLALNGANTYAGTTRIAAGALSLGNAAALQNTTLDMNAGDSGTISAISTNATFGGLMGSRNLDMLTRTLSIGNNNQSTNYSGNLSNGVLTKIGSGTLALSGSNSFTSATISAGVLTVGGAGALGSGTTPLAVNAGSLDLAGTSVSVGLLTGLSGGTITSGVAGAATLTVNAASAATFPGRIQNGSGTVWLTKQGAGTFTLSGSNSYSGDTTIAAGVLALGGATALAGGGNVVFTGGTLQFGAANTIDYGARIKNSSAAIVLDTNSQSFTMSGAIDSTNTGGLTKAGAGTLTLSGSNTYAGTTTILQGGVTINSVAPLPGYATAGRVAVASGATLTVQSGVSNADLALLANTGSYAAGSTLVIETWGGSRTVTQSLAGGYGITKSGANTLVLSGSNSYTGNTRSNAGTIQAGSPTAFGTGTVSTTAGAGTGGIDLNGFSFSNNVSLGNQATGPSDAGALQNTNTSSTSVLSGNVLIDGENYVGGNGNITFTGTISGGLGTTYSFYKQGSGTWRFASTTNTFNGFYYHVGGVTEVTKLANINEASSLGQPTTATANRFSFGFGAGTGGTLRFTGTDASTSDRAFILQGATDAASNRIEASGASAAATLTLTGSLSTAVAGSYTLSLAGTNAGVNTFSGAIANGSGTVGLVKEGLTTWRLAGANTFTGATTLASGRLVLDYATQNNSKLGDTGVLTLGSGTVAGVTLELAGGSHSEAVGSTTLLAPTTITRSSGSSVIQLGTITRSGNLATLSLPGSGIATTSSLNSNGILGAWAIVGGTSWATNATNASNGSIDAYTGYTDVDAQGGSITSNTASNVRINAAGTSGPITLGTGTTDVNTLLQATATAATLDTAGRTLRLGASGGILIPAGNASVTFGTASGDGTLTAGGAADTAGTLTVTTLGSTTATINAAIANNGTGVVSLMKTGPGTLALTGSASYTGATVISGGTIALSSGANRLGSTGGLTLAGGGLELSGVAQSVPGVVVGVGGGRITGSGTLTNSGSYTLTSGESLTATPRLAGNLWAVGSGTTTFSGGLTTTSRMFVGSGGTLIQDGGNATTTNWMMVGRNDGTAGPGLAGAGSYVMQSGTLTVGRGIYLGWTTNGSGTFTQNGGFVETQDDLQGLQIGLDGGRGAYVLNSGTLFSNFGTFNTGLAYSGTFTFGGGTFRTRASFNTNLQPGVATTIAAGATAFIDTDGKTVTWTAPLTGTSAAGLSKLGTGLLTLSGSNTYGGTTTISGGTLALSGTGTIASSSGVNLSASGARFDIAAASGSRTVGGLEGIASTGILLGGNSLTAGDATNRSFGGVISGSGGFTKAGTGLLALTAIQGFTGTARVDAGTLSIGGTNTLAAASRIFVAAGATLDATAAGLGVSSGQTLGGYGSITGNVNFLAGSVLAPGGSVGTLTETGTAVFSGNGSYVFEVTNPGGSTPGTDWDLFVAGSLSIASSVANPYVINLTSLASGTDSTPGAMSGWDPDTSYSWMFVDTANTITGFDPSQFSFNLTNFQPYNTVNGSFSVAVGGVDNSNLYIVYAAVPEPGTLVLAGIGLVAAGWMVRRRRDG